MTLTRISAEGARINDAVIALLELTPEQAHDLNASLGKFYRRLRDEEVAKAFIRTLPGGREEIVVPGFDRTSLIEDFRAELTTLVGQRATELLGSLMHYDSTLAIGNWEMRAFTEKGEQNAVRNGRTQALPEAARSVVEWDVFVRKVSERPQMMRDPLTSKMLSMPEISTQSSRHPSTVGHHHRTQHLWSAKDRLPRR